MEETEPRTEPASQKTTLALVVASMVACFAVFGVLGFGGVTLLTRSLKSSDAYRAGLEYLRSEPRVIGDLGTPIDDGFMPSGRVSVSAEGGDAELTIPLSGPKGSGAARLELERAGGAWSVQRAEWGFAGKMTELVSRPRPQTTAL